MTRDEQMMDLALHEASNARYATSPNPMVGAIVVVGDEVVASGYHERAGEPHAEVTALRKAGERAHGGSLYVTLEPCVHAGKTPPCMDTILASGIERVVVATIDPNPMVNGKGIAALRRAGVIVDVGTRQFEAQQLIEYYAKHIVSGVPFVTAKIAMSLDGKTATATGESQWITCDESRRFAHELRAMHDVILVGADTVISDNPLLTTRLEGNDRSPFRIVVDSTLRVSPSAAIFSGSPGTAMVATTDRAVASRRSEFEAAGVSAVIFPTADGKVSLPDVLRYLGKRPFISALIEGGSAVHGAAFDGGLVDKVVVCIAPRIIGGVGAIPSIGGRGVEHLQEARLLDNVTVRQSGCDFIVSGYCDHHV